MIEILEVGEIQILPEFPAEMVQLKGKLCLSENANLELASQNARLRYFLVVGALLLGVGLIWYFSTERDKIEEENKK